MPIKLVACDMDDTLLRSDDSLAPRTLAALAEAKARGAKIVLASGRMIESMLDTARSVSVNAPIIAYNGGAVYDLKTEAILHQAVVPAAAARELCALAESLGIHAQAYQDGGYFFEAHNAESDRYGSGIHLRGSAVGRPLSEWIEQGQLKILLIGGKDRISEVLPAFQARFAGRVSCINSKPIYIECVAPGVDKGTALKALAQDLGIQMEDVCAFGDGQNDVGMLTAAGNGYAMGNAPESVKGAVGRVAPSNDEDGVAQIIEQLIGDGRIGS